MRFLVDENVRAEVGAFLASIGDAESVPRGASDAEVGRIAMKSSRTLITHDKDFANPLAFPPGQYAGIVVVRIHPPRPDEIIAAFSALFDRLSVDQIMGKLVILERSRYLLYPTDG